MRQPQEELISAAEQLANLLLSFGEKNDGTAYPFWFIATKSGMGHRQIIHAGPWFSRDAADLHLSRKSHRYPKTAFVYCGSGHDSYDFRAAQDLAKEIKKVIATVEAE